MIRAIAIDGSKGKSGETARLVKELGMKTYRLADGIDPAVKAILKTDVIVFATPTYWFNVSALMKELIEQLPEAPKFPCEGKIAYFLAVCNEDGAQQAIHQMMGPLNHMGFRIPPYACYFYNTTMAEKSENRWQVKGIPELRKRLTGEHVTDILQFDLNTGEVADGASLVYDR